MNNSEINDPLFREAVEAIDAGDVAALQGLLIEHPRLVYERLKTIEEGYFKDPYLLWFIADNPIRQGKLPSNIIDITRLLIQAVRKVAGDSLQHQLDYALGLVVTGRIPKECGVQIALIDLLIDEGAKPGKGHGAIAHGNIEAAGHLLKRGGDYTLTTAVCLDELDDAIRLEKTAGDTEKQLALTAAAFSGKAGMVSFLLRQGVNPNIYPDKSTGFHVHATPLHQAVNSGLLEVVKILVEAGANTELKDKIYEGTAFDWAQHLKTETKDEPMKQKYALIEKYLLDRKAR